ncbi:hypothetical protein H257_05105 [Aphanomyces astaci]|uniref:ATP-dependent DNA helicase n=2 Tax=Aphanomyces astaci TaxID=112090 RepID=W4GT17_APHAT|nr:hypothetical protein H257_05105 [Aphanomyces astaci]ETV82481.1 hypothetical protein H257_05105 [Aphanomyces astaci]|eukprot:XP_009828150.1 hypothetical protein H257_05105 [Aphanomyces astaci]
MASTRVAPTNGSAFKSDEPVGIRCDVEIQLAVTGPGQSGTGKNVSSTTLRSVVLCKRKGGLQVLRQDYKAAIRTLGVEVFFGQVANGKLTFIRREFQKYTQYNFFNGSPRDMVELKDFALSQGGIAKSKAISTTHRSDELIPQAKAKRTTIIDKPVAKKARTTATSTNYAPSSSPMLPEPERKLTMKQAQVLQAIQKKENVFFTGRAGTGKSFLLGHIRRAMPKQGLFLTATTGIAAFNINGMTLHHFAGLPQVDTFDVTMLMAAVQRNRQALIRWRDAVLLVIDEVSMLDGQMFDALETIARIVRQSKLFFGGIQLVLSGDFYQLPPVTKGEPTFCFESQAWQRGINTSICLDQVFRQSDDPEFVAMLNAIRVGTHTSAMIKTINARCVDRRRHSASNEAIHIFSHNAEVLAMNNARLEHLDGDIHDFFAIDTGDKGLLKGSPIPVRIQLKQGARVMLTKNLSVAAGLVNGSRGEVVGFASGTNLPIVRFDHGVTHPILKEGFSVVANHTVVANRQQLPLTLAYAISIHKSQGLTFDNAVLHLGKVFEYGQAYVALSRLSSLAGLTLASPLSHQTIRVHPRLLVTDETFCTINQDCAVATVASTSTTP